MRVRTDHLAKVGLLILVLHVGVTIGKRSHAPIVVTLPQPLPQVQVIETGSARAQRIALPTQELLPPLHERLPKMGTPEFEARMRKLGLDPAVVQRFSEMQKRQKMTAFRE